MISYIMLLSMLVSQPADGTLLFFRNSGRETVVSRGIEKATGDNLIHVAIILYVGDEPFVYESAPPMGVQRRPINQYFEIVKKQYSSHPLKAVEIEFVEPDKPYSKEELKKMKEYADSQLGRPYAIRQYLTEREIRGTHCAQYVANILEKSGRIKSLNFKDSPARLYSISK